MTDAEQKLWYLLRRDRFLGLHFRRQHPLGPYTLDFFCPPLRLCIEVDGGQHAEQQSSADDRRARWLAGRGVVVVRYWNNDVLQNVEGVLTDLADRARQWALKMTPSLTLPLSGGGNGEAAAPAKKSPRP